MHWRRMCILLLWDRMLYICQLNPFSNMLLKACVSLLSLYLDDLSIDVSWVLKSHTVIVSPFISVNICLIY